MTPAEDLYAPGRSLRTFGMAVDMLLLPAGAIVVVAAVLPSSAFSATDRLWALLAGVGLLVVGVVTLRHFVAQGRKVGAVYGIKAARRAGLVSGPHDVPRSPPVEVRDGPGTPPGA